MQKSLQLNWAIQIWISTLSQPTSLQLRTSLLQTLMLTKHLSMICKPMTSLLVTSTLVNWMQVNLDFTEATDDNAYSYRWNYG